MQSFLGFSYQYVVGRTIQTAGAINKFRVLGSIRSIVIKKKRWQSTSVRENEWYWLDCKNLSSFDRKVSVLIRLIWYFRGVNESYFAYHQATLFPESCRLITIYSLSRMLPGDLSPPQRSYDCFLLVEPSLWVYAGKCGRGKEGYFLSLAFGIPNNRLGTWHCMIIITPPEERA